MVKKTRNRKCDVLKKPINFLADWRPLPFYELMSYILMYANISMLTYGIQVYDLEIVRIIILTILTMYSGFFAALIWNDITDADIDTIVHRNNTFAHFLMSFFVLWVYILYNTYVFAKVGKEDVKKMGEIVGEKGLTIF